jgi:hypothetical protein
MFRWFATDGFRADLSAVRALHPGIQNFEHGLRTAQPVQTQRR